MYNTRSCTFLVLIAAFYLIISSASGATTGSSAASSTSYLYATGSVQITTSYSNPYYSPIAGSPLQPYSVVSQTSQVSISNNATSAWLLTCPSPPGPVGTSSSEYFGSGAVPYIAGDVCTANPSDPLDTQLTLQDAVTDSPTVIATATPSLLMKNPASVVISDLGYTPSVDKNVSNGYSSKSNIFDFGGVPSRNQQGLWSWYAKYADFQDNYQSGSLTVPPTSFSETYTTTGNSGAACTYPYTVTVSSTLDTLNNAQIPFEYKTGSTSGSFEASVLPYFLYNYNLTVPSTPNVILNMSYDIYGPLTYGNPQKDIEPFPINTSSYFFVNNAGTGSQASSQLTPYSLDTVSAQYGYLSLHQPISTSPIINAQGTSVSAPSTSSTSPSGSGGSCSVTDLNCIAAVIHGLDGGSFMSEPQYAGYEIEGMQQMGQTYHFPWEYMYAFLMGQECQNCIYEINPTGSASSPSSPNNCYNYWSYTLFPPIPPGTPTCTSVSSGYGLPSGSGDQYYNFNINNDPAASMTNANQQLLAYWADKNPGKALTTCDFNTFIRNALKYFNPGASPSTYEASASAILKNLFGPNWQQVITSSTTGTGDGGCTSPGPEAVTTITAASSTQYSVSAISTATTPNNYVYVLTQSSLGGTSITGTTSSTGFCNSNFETVTGGLSASTACSNANLAGCSLSTICSAALSQLGVPYCFAGQAIPRGQTIPEECSNPNSGLCQKCSQSDPLSGVFDCYALVDWAIAQALSMPFTSVDLQPSSIGSPFSSPLITQIQQSQTVPGDLVFLDIPGESGLQPIHAAICFNNGCTLIIDAENFKAYVGIDSVSAFGATAEYYASVKGASSLPSGTSGISRSGYYIDIGRLIPQGYYNVSGPSQQPDSVQQSQPQSAWESEWNAYWQQTQKLQGASVYMIKSIPVENLNCADPSCGMQSSATINNNQMTNIHDNGFTPYNITVSDNGIIYLIGNFSISGDFYGQATNPSINVPGIVRITDPTGDPQVFEKLLILHPNSKDIFNPGEGSPWAGKASGCTGSTLSIVFGCKNVDPGGPDLQTFSTPPVSQEFSEITTSPNGQVVYLANPYNGTIQLIDGSTLQPNGQYLLAFGDYGGSPASSPPVANLSIYSYLYGGGLFGIGVSKVPQIYGTIRSGEITGPTPATYTGDKTLASLLESWSNPGPSNNYPSGGYITNPSVDPGSDLIEYHHPLAISDVNGYLYVLDDWNDAAGYIGHGLGNIRDINNHGSCGVLQVYGNCGAGVYFQILDLRVLNASGTDVPINPMPASIDDMILPLVHNPDNNYPVETFTDPNSKYDPPYGWILAANISQQNNQPSNANANVRFCGSSACPYNPQTLVPAGSFNPQNLPQYGYSGVYEPIGPQLLNWVAGVGIATPELAGVGLSATGDGQLSMLFPNPAATNANPGKDAPGGGLLGGSSWSGWPNSPSDCQNLPNGKCMVANVHSELIFATLSPENYTNQALSYPPSICYAQDTGMTGGNGADCQGTGHGGDLVPGFSAPITQIVDPLKTLENVGSFRIISIPSVFATSGATSCKSGSPSCTTGSYQTALQNNQNCAEAIGSGKAIPSSCSAANNFGSSTSQASGNIGTPQPTFQPSSVASTLGSGITGNLIVPYTYSISTSVQYSPSPSPSSSSSCPSPSSIFHDYSTQTGPLYGYAVVPVESNPFTASVQGGGTYLQNQNGQYYVPTLSDANVIIPLAELFNVFTNRVFGSEWLNMTLNPQTNSQITANATSWLQYQVNAYTQGAGRYPAYQTISSSLMPTPLVGPQYAPSVFANNQNIAHNLGAEFGFYNIPVPSGVNLFNWYQTFVYSSALNFITSGSNLAYTYAGSQYTSTILGYQRLIYTLNDKFNNTIYAPVDADIARVTVLDLSVIPNVAQGNANQTTLEISGTAGFTDLTGTFIPLTDSPIYIYYDKNLNYMMRTVSSNGQVSIAPATVQQATACAFSSTASPAACIPANPLATDTSESTVAGTVTYYTQGTSVTGTSSGLVETQPNCYQPPKSLLAPPNLDCNIYQDNGKTSDGIPLPSCTPQNGQPCTATGTNPDGTKNTYNWYGTTCPSGPPQEYCTPFYSNGTGTCTSQVGLIGVATTDPNGHFSLSQATDPNLPYGVVACGNAAATITAQFYGYPPPEPIPAQQNYLPYAYSAAGTLPVLQEATFQVYNYYWTPNETVQSTEIGLLLLSYGDITGPAIAAAIIASVLLVILMRKVGRKSRNGAGIATRGRSRTG